MFTIVFQRGYISILYQKYVINGKKLQYFGYGAKCCLLLLLVFNRFFDESFGNFCGLFVVFVAFFFVENLVLPPIKLPVHIIYT